MIDIRVVTLTLIPLPAIDGPRKISIGRSDEYRHVRGRIWLHSRQCAPTQV